MRIEFQSNFGHRTAIKVYLIFLLAAWGMDAQPLWEVLVVASKSNAIGSTCEIEFDVSMQHCTCEKGVVISSNYPFDDSQIPWGNGKNAVNEKRK